MCLKDKSKFFLFKVLMGFTISFFSGGFFKKGSYSKPFLKHLTLFTPGPSLPPWEAPDPARHRRQRHAVGRGVGVGFRGRGSHGGGIRGGCPWAKGSGIPERGYPNLISRERVAKTKMEPETWRPWRLFVHCSGGSL